MSLIPGVSIPRGHTFTHGLSWFVMGPRLGCFWWPTACLLNQRHLWHCYLLPPSAASTTYNLAYLWTIDSKKTLSERFCANNAVIFLIIIDFDFQHQLTSINCTSRDIFLITARFSSCCWPESWILNLKYQINGSERIFASLWNVTSQTKSPSLSSTCLSSKLPLASPMNSESSVAFPAQKFKCYQQHKRDSPKNV